MFRSILFTLTLLTASLANAGSPTGNLSGAWFDPGQPGHGILIEADAETITAFWFTYDFSGNQAWFVTDSPRPNPEGLSRPQEFVLYQPAGFFPAEAVDLGEPVGTLSITPWFTLQDGEVLVELEVEWFIAGSVACPPVDFSPAPPCGTENGSAWFEALLGGDG